MTITTVVVKPASRGYVRLRSADPDDMPLVSPHLLKEPDDMARMIDGTALLPARLPTSPLAERIEAVRIPDPADLSDEAHGSIAGAS